MSQFEDLVRHLYAEVPPAGDAALFARRLQDRLERGWMARRLVIGAAGAASAMVAVWRMAGTVLAARLEDTARSAFALIDRRLGLWIFDSPMLRVLHLPGEVLWLLGGLVLLAAGLLATRLVDGL